MLRFELDGVLIRGVLLLLQRYQSATDQDTVELDVIRIEVRPRFRGALMISGWFIRRS